MKAEEESKNESESSDSEEDSVINLILILNLPEEKIAKIRIAEKIDDFFDDEVKMQRKERTKVMNAKEYCGCDIDAISLLSN